MTLLWWKMNFISCHIQNSLLLWGRSESGKRNSLSSFGSWSEWAQEWVEIHFSAMTQISSQTCPHWQACTDTHGHGSLYLDCPLQGNADSSLSRKKPNLCGAENRETFALETLLMSLSQGGQQRPCRAAGSVWALKNIHHTSQVWSVTCMKKYAVRQKKNKMLNIKMHIKSAS